MLRNTLGYVQKVIAYEVAGCICQSKAHVLVIFFYRDLTTAFLGNALQHLH